MLFWLQPHEFMNEEGDFYIIDKVVCIQSETHISEFSCTLTHCVAIDGFSGCSEHAIESFYWYALA